MDKKDRVSTIKMAKKIFEMVDSSNAELITTITAAKVVFKVHGIDDFDNLDLATSAAADEFLKGMIEDGFFGGADNEN